MRTIIFETQGVEPNQAPSIKKVHFFYDRSIFGMPHCSTPLVHNFQFFKCDSSGNYSVRLGILQKIKKWLWNIFAC